MYPIRKTTKNGFFPLESCRNAYNLTPESTTYDCTLIFVSGIIKSTRLPRLNRRVNRAGSLFAGTHGQNDRGGTGDGVAAGVDHRAAGQAVGAVRDQAAVLVGVQTRRGGADQRVGAGAQRHDHRINVQNELAALLDDGAAAAGGRGKKQGKSRIHGTGMRAAQNIQVKGTVVSGSDNEPLPGVNVVVKGTTNGGITDLDGNFTLSVPADATLEEVINKLAMMGLSLASDDN